MAIANGASRVAAKSGHGVGKSAFLSWLGLWGLTCWDDVKIPITAPTSAQLRDVIRSEILKWKDNLLSPFKETLKVTNDRVWYEGSSGFLVFRTARKEKPEALQGFHSGKLIFLVDEASGVDDEIFQPVGGALSTEGAVMVMTGNPTRNSGYFWSAFNKNRDRWERFTFSSADSPLVSKEHIEDMKQEYGVESDIYRVRVLGEFGIKGERQFISTKTVEAAIGRFIKEDMFNFAPVILGVDVALYGGDRSVIYLRQGLYSKILFEIRGIRPKDLAAQVARYEDEYKADAVIVDSIGIGEGVISALQMMNRKPILFNAAKTATKPQYYNMRAQVWGEMRDWLEHGGVLEDHKDLLADLTGPEYGFNTAGEIVLERKSDMKVRRIPSPDLADALAMTFGAHVVKKSMTEQLFYDTPTMLSNEWDNYNPLGI